MFTLIPYCAIKVRTTLDQYASDQEQMKYLALYRSKYQQ